MNTHSALLSYLKYAQLLNGSFENSPFQTSLILICLSKLKNDPEVKIIAQSAIRYLFSQGSLHGSWNYWDRSHPKSQSLPDDLDDTSMAIAAISIHQPDLIDENMLLSFVQNLVNSEVKEGGPYYTWLVPTSMRESWDDMDITVNCNIGLALHLNHIHLTPLEEFLSDKITYGQFESKYYSPLHICYFLSRWSDLNKKALMKLLTRQYPSISNHLDRALFVSTYVNLGGDPQKISHEMKRLSKIKVSQLKPHPFYIEEIQNNIQIYAGSRSLTAAFILEALSRDNIPPLSTEKLLIEKVSKDIINKFQNAPVSIQKQLLASLEKMKSYSKASEIFLLPLLWQNSLYKKFRKSHAYNQTMELCAANVLGWIAFSIYDDVIDGERKEGLIPLANICARKISRALAKHESLLDKIDYANCWEQINCRITLTNNIFELPKPLPYYGNLEQLAYKSIGHAIGPLLISPIQKEYIRDFFIHYLIAKQLNDDAHDWLDDLHQGFLNPVSVQVLEKFRNLYPQQKQISLEHDRTVLQSLFWHEVIDTVRSEVLRQITQARDIAKKITILERRTIIETLLSPLEKSAEQALHERDNAIRFIEKYR